VGSGFEVILAGPDETIDCSNSPALLTHLYIETPAQTGVFDYDRDREPAGGTPIIANLKPAGNGSIESFFPDRSQVEITAVSDGFASGTMSFLAPHIGQVNGAFKAKVCSFADQLDSLPKIWQGVGTIEPPGAPPERQELEFQIGVSAVPGSETRRLSLRLVNLQTEKTILDNSGFLIDSQGISQNCAGRRFRRGRVIRSIGRYLFSGMTGDCFSSGENITLELHRSTLSLSGTANNPFSKAKFTIGTMRPKLGP
jgi:hypothetical protein